MTVMEFDGSVFLECQNGLPEAAKNREQLDIVFDVKCREVCFQIVGEDLYACWPPVEGEIATFTIPKIAK